MELKYATDNTEKPKQTLDDVLANLGGARWRPAQVVNEPDLYLPVTVEHIGSILGDTDESSKARHVMGTTPEQIFTELLNRYPCAIPNGRYIVETSDVAYTEVTHGKEDRWSRQQRSTSSKQALLAWMKLKSPFVSGIATVDELIATSRAWGPVVIDYADTLFGSCNHKEKAEEAGLVSTPLGYKNLVRLNFNPAAFCRRDYNERLKLHWSRSAYEFPDELLFGLYKLLTEWPSQHPLNDTVRRRNLTRRSGWGREVNNTFTIYQVVGIIDINRKLHGKPFWRDIKPGRSSYDAKLFKKLLELFLLHLHGVEAGIEAAKKYETFRLKNRYEDYCRAFDAYRQLPPDDASRARYEANSYYGNRLQPITLTEFTTDTKGEFLPERKVQTNARLCRWLRQEARALKLKLPRASVEPVKPKPKRRT